MLWLRWTVSLGKSDWWSSSSGLQPELCGRVARTYVRNLTLSEKKNTVSTNIVISYAWFFIFVFYFKSTAWMGRKTEKYVKKRIFSEEKQNKRPISDTLHFPLLTWPPPLSLFVSLTLLKETGAFIQCAPKFGESGWMYTQLGVWGSGLPPGTHSPFTYFHLWLSADTKSSKKEYMAFGSNPDTFIFSTGNMRLDDKNNYKYIY